MNQADINDVRNYENIFKPRGRELNRTPEPKDEDEYELFQPPLSGSESDNNISRYAYFISQIAIINYNTSSFILVNGYFPTFM